MNLCEIKRGDSPLVVDVPHAGTHIPEAIVARLTPAARAVPDTDWHVEKLFSFAREMGATLLAATHSRYVVDLNRDPSGAALYPGADNTELCPTRTFKSAGTTSSNKTSSRCEPRFVTVTVTSISVFGDVRSVLRWRVASS